MSRRSFQSSCDTLLRGAPSGVECLFNLPRSRLPTAARGAGRLRLSQEETILSRIPGEADASSGFMKAARFPILLTSLVEMFGRSAPPREARNTSATLFAWSGLPKSV